MKKIIIARLLLFCFTLFISFSTSSISIATNMNENEDIFSFKVTSITMNPIYINHDDNFSTLYGFSGTGEENEPYIIAGYNISNSTKNLIEIVNTRKYFIVKDCDLNGQNGYIYGVLFNNVSHGTVLENNITNCMRGIHITSGSLYNTISWNNITGSSQYAIFSHDSNYTLFEGNQIYDNNRGLDLTYSYHNTIYNNKIFDLEEAIDLALSNFNILKENEIYNCSSNAIVLHSRANNNSIVNNDIHLIGSDYWGSAIYFYDQCSYNNISWNTIRNNEGYGIFAESMIAEELGIDNTIISYNNISNCRSGAIYLQISFSNTIQYNTFYNNSHQYDFNLYLSDSSRNTITFNTFMKNYPVKLTYQSSGNNISWNDFIGNSWGETENSSNTFDSNYYDGYYSSDINVGGYYNEPQTIYQGCEDVHPMIAPSNTAMAFMEYLTYPRIIFPSFDYMENLVGTIAIKWLESFGSPGKTITYSVYYMNTATDQSYTQIAAGLTTTQYNWDTTTVPDGSEYAIKVVASCSGVESAEWSVGNTLIIYNEGPPTEHLTTEHPTTEPSITSSWTIIISLLALTGIFIRRNKKS